MIRQTTTVSTIENPSCLFFDSIMVISLSGKPNQLAKAQGSKRISVFKSASLALVEPLQIVFFSNRIVTFMAYALHAQSLVSEASQGKCKFQKAGEDRFPAP